MIRTTLGLLAAGLMLQGCAEIRQGGVIVARPGRDWRQAVTPRDRERLRDWRKTWVSAIDKSKAAGNAARIAAEGKLLDPDAALGGPIPNGIYRCRLVMIGAKTPGAPSFEIRPPTRCEIHSDGDRQVFAALGGTQRQVGLIFPADPLREIFLGSLQFRDENRPMQYGWDRQRDIAGYVERIGPARWRLTMPAPHFDSLLQVVELVPN